MSDTVIKTIAICFTIICVFYIMSRVMIAEQISKNSFDEEEENTDNEKTI
jgi:hypothetical protein